MMLLTQQLADWWNLHYHHVGDHSGLCYINTCRITSVDRIELFIVMHSRTLNDCFHFNNFRQIMIHNKNSDLKSTDIDL